MASTRIDVRRRLKDALLAVRASRSAAFCLSENGQADLPVVDLSRLLGLLMVGAAGPEGDTIASDVVGFGSAVIVQDLDTGARSVHRLMSAHAMVLEAGHVTVDSPMGTALLGGRRGDVVHFKSPGGARRLRLEHVQTVHELLDGVEAAAGERAGSGRIARQERSSDARTGTDG